VLVNESQTPNSAQPFLSIVIPAYNEEARLPESLNVIAEFASKPYQWKSSLWITTAATGPF
jgi:cellulose synthase/poly-beta-1,6-N-acetylglucosamine synthase-like glycosyltransferase